ncbi:MAG: adenosylcobinamide-phosphate synthase CbiB [Clostridia bacterium]|nr:adenosylcobinamide-phosphate synthase CbiB [[Bacteroides] pectinophilus]MDD5874038.1 adenosylcobinamide-phosphate synthase CbiB [Clostridia bacterium]
MREWIIMQLLALPAAFILDMIFGDPHSRLHPICLIGNLIAMLDSALNKENISRNTKIVRGALTAVTVIVISTAVPLIIELICFNINIWLFFAAESVMDYFVIAAKSLKKESMLVCSAMEAGDTEGARHAVSMIVGRDTKVLDREGIIKAAVETVAENSSDGVIAPILYTALCGAAGGFFYKAVNTMDSMLGYVNDRYEAFGKAAARLDDVMNYIPSRLSALFIIAAAKFTGLNAAGAWKIFRRDRMKHASPNSAQTESACAGALDVRLAGNAWYGGVLHEKPYIGDDIRLIEPEDIRKACRLMYAASIAAIVIFGTAAGFLKSFLF